MNIHLGVVTVSNPTECLSISNASWEVTLPSWLKSAAIKSKALAVPLLVLSPTAKRSASKASVEDILFGVLLYSKFATILALWPFKISILKSPFGLASVLSVISP